MEELAGALGNVGVFRERSWMVFDTERLSLRAPWAALVVLFVSSDEVSSSSSAEEVTPFIGSADAG